MNYKRYLLEVGAGIDLHGEDDTKAAQRAVRNAINWQSMVGLSQLFKFESWKELSDALLVDVTIATPHPEKVDKEKVLSVLPIGKKQITVVKGGLRFPTPETSELSRTHGVVVAVAAIVVLIDLDKVERV
ncbi:hypothetical protein DRO56_00595 [Candidatus Bathyarchaeota archaeon]|nr:MAG: hypothetical protein CW700_05505 [Candidatus Bathyarchaeota archaeon]RLI33886.1 MAG: hypothetical protein DRO56_00595 [Candidatus Bathyarchaeota archaeon]